LITVHIQFHFLIKIININRYLLVLIKKDGFKSNIDKNQEFFFHLVNDVAQKIQKSKKDNTDFDSVIHIGDKDWVIQAKQKTDPLISRIFSAIHRQCK
jgi:hypothetical protein